MAALCWRFAGNGVSSLRRQAVTTVPITIVVVFGLDVVFRRTTGIHDHLPPTFFLWIGVVVLTILARPSGRRTLLGLAVVMAGVNAFVQINAHYAYFPNTDTLLGRPGPDDLSAAAFASAVSRTPDHQPGRQHHGKYIPLDIAPTVSGFPHRPGSVWLPPAYFDGRRADLPVILMLSGAPGSPVAWPRSGFALRTADRYASAHGGFAPILVFADQNGSSLGDTECVDGPRGHAETFLTTDVQRFLHHRLHVSPGPERTAVVGFSEGGTCALELALRHPDLYGNFVDLAGDSGPKLGSSTRTLSEIYGGNRSQMAGHDVKVLVASRKFPHLQAWFYAGRGDTRHIADARRGAAAVRAATATVHHALLRGGHDWTFAGDAFRLVLPPLSHTMELPR